MTENLRMTVKFDDFKSKVNSLISEAEPISASKFDDEGGLTIAELAYKEWSQKARNYLISAFNQPSNFVVSSFVNAHANRFYSGVGASMQSRIETLKENLTIKCTMLRALVELLAVCDAIIAPNSIDLDERANLTITEKIDLLMEKLYHLNPDGYHEITEILEGNGVKLRSQTESRELANIIEANGWGEMFGGLGVEANIRLLSPGVHYVESNLKA